MTYQLEPRPELLTPEYWGGLDITNTSHFPGSEEPGVFLTSKEQRRASFDLADCLRQVTAGDYIETPGAIDQTFNPSEGHLTDGSVVVIDREQLVAWDTRKSHPTAKPHPTLEGLDSTEPISEPFAEYWRKHRPMHPSDNTHFASEAAVFPELPARYQRFLEWGVLLTRQRSHNRYLATWALSAVKVAEDAVSVPLGGSIHFRTAKALPLEIGETQAHPIIETLLGNDRMLSRVRDVRVIYPDEGPRQRRGGLKQRLQNVAVNLGEMALPVDASKLIPLPVSNLHR